MDKYTAQDEPSFSIKPSSAFATDLPVLVLSACGLAALSLWTDMIGHVSALLASADAVAPFANARSFYLAGLSLGAAVLAAAPRRLQRLAASRLANLALGLLLSALTLCYGLATQLQLLPVDALVMLSLAGIGLGFAWLSTQLLCQLSLGKHYRRLLLGIAAGLLLKTALSPLIEGMFPTTAQSVCSLLLPLLAAVALLLAQRCSGQGGQGLPGSGQGGQGLPGSGQGDSGQTCPTGQPSRPCSSQGGPGQTGPGRPDAAAKPAKATTAESAESRMLLVLLLAIALLRAVIRVMSTMGFWGSGYSANTLLGPFDIVLMVALLLATLWATTLRQRPGAVPVAQFLPGFLVVLAGLLLLDPQVTGIIGLKPWLAYLLNIFIELFTHLFFWGIIVFGMRSLSMPSQRVAGITILAYALTSLAATLAFNRPDASYRLLAVLLLYAFIVALMLMFTLSHKLPAAGAAGDGSGGEGGGGNASDTTCDSDNANGGDTATGKNTVDKNGTGPAGEATGKAIAQLAGLAQQKGLSPRETEVFMLLAQGRNRPFIQQQLFLADGTVKTHITRIYQKLGVTNRQQLISLVQGLKD